VHGLRRGHPSGQTANHSVRKFAEDVFTMTINHALAITQCLTKPRMPAVVNRCPLEEMCIMWLIRPAWARASSRRPWCRKPAGTDTRPYITRAAARFRDLALASADGSLRLLLAKLSRIDVLVIDDWAMAPLTEPERRDFWEICEDHYHFRTVILTSQLPVARRHEQIGDPTVAGGILDRLVHNATGSRCVVIRCGRSVADSRRLSPAGSLQC
jgi:IstB-like ATP binding protein